MKPYLFEGYDPSLRDKLGDDAILVTGRNFGIGSSREHRGAGAPGACPPSSGTASPASSAGTA